MSFSFVIAMLLAFAVGFADAATLLFQAPLDGSPVATVAAGKAEPIEAKGLEWAEGLRPGTQALRMRSGARPRLTYSAEGNLPLGTSGTVAMWTRREWKFDAPKQPWRALFATPMADRDKKRVGSGALWFWWFGAKLRADQSDPKDRYTTLESFPLDGDWVHLAFSWRPGHVDIFVNGRPRRHLSDSASPIRTALADAKAVANPIDRSAIDRFFLGNVAGSDVADSLFADLRIYDEPLSDDEVRAIWKEGLPPGQTGTGTRKPIDWAALADASALRYERSPIVMKSPSSATREAPGTIAPNALELVQEIRLDERFAATDPAPEGFRSLGSLRVGSLGGVPYLEAGSAQGDRFAVRLRLPDNAPLCVVEIDVPDDALRTEDLIIQPCKGGGVYAMQVGLLLGDEYPNSGKMITQRRLLWTYTNDVALVAMTARKGAPAALAAVRVYRLRGDRLPVVQTKTQPTGGRHVALYFEDPSINQEFGIPSDVAAHPKGFAEELSRLAATMKFTGEDMLFYPGAWYQGLIDSEGYNPRGHAPQWRLGVYEVFDREGLGFVPTINLNNISVKPGLVTVPSLDDGSLYNTPLVIQDTGRPNPGTWHDTPPNFNCQHPDVQRAVEEIVDTLVAEGASHPSFGGVCLHLTQHCLLWWGNAKSGYNDYTVDAFCRDTHRTIPASIDRTAPLRGAAYAEWLRSDPALWEAWIQWRCDQVTAFWARLAAKVAAARPGAKLYINNFVPPDMKAPDFPTPDYVRQEARRCGLDVPGVERAIPNVVVMQTDVPADYRWSWRGRYPGDKAQYEAAHAHQRVLDATPGFWALLGETAHPWANQHDRYWESAIGRRGDTLSCDWLSECPWRVSTLNPAGDHTMTHYVRPLRFHDSLGFSKGGFLIGTYGMEPRLAHFSHVFRALPPVVLPDLPASTDAVKVRGGEWNGRHYLYAVNVTPEPAAIPFRLSQVAKDLATGKEIPATAGTLRLGPYELRAFSWP